MQRVYGKRRSKRRLKFLVKGYRFMLHVLRGIKVTWVLELLNKSLVNCKNNYS